MKDIQTVGQATEYAERSIEAIGLKIEELDVTERAAFEIKTAPLLKDLSMMVPDPDLQSRFNKVLVEPYPPGAGDERILEALHSKSDAMLNDVLAYGDKVGLDTEDILARMQAGGTKNYGLAQNWVERDMNAVLAPDGLTVDTATEAQSIETLKAVDMFMDGLGDRVRELSGGLRAGQGLGEQDPGEGEELSLIDDGDIKQQNGSLQELADILKLGELNPEHEQIINTRLKTELSAALGSQGMAALRKGNYSVLEQVLPSKFDQITVAQEYLEMAREETGDMAFSELAASMQQDKSVEAARMRHEAEMHQQDRGHELDDDMGL